jgi:hypothetical protein
MQLGLIDGPREAESHLRAAILPTGVTYVSAIDALCQEAGCLTMSEGQPTAWDGSHLTKTGSRVLARVILAALNL